MPRHPRTSDPNDADVPRPPKATRREAAAAASEVRIERADDRDDGRVVGHPAETGVERRIRPRPPDDVAPATPITAAELWDVLGTVTEAVIVVDRHWRIRYLNGAAAGAAGVEPESAVGASFWAVYRPLAGGDFHDRLTEAMRERQAIHLETYAPSLGGWVVAGVHPTTDGLLVVQHVADGAHAAEDPRHLLEAERAARADAERQREQAERLAAELQTARETADGVRRAAERARTDAEAAARAKSDFLATMSHELRTPINAITGYTQLLELGVAGPLTDSQRSYLARLYASGRHLLGLVDDVLDLANIERGRMSITRDRLMTGTVVAAALALITPETAARSIRLLDERQGDAGLPFLGDEHRVRQILLNLLSNAVKFTPPGGTVAVGCDRVVRPEPSDEAPTGDWVCISVRDTGIGIAPDKQAAIFEPFMQADSSRTRTAGGTGLGLALSRRLARLMGGDLRVTSRVGHGSTFTLFLPAVSAEDAEVTPAPTPEAIVADASRPTRDRAGDRVWTTPALAELGARMREQIEPLIDAFVARLRGDATFGGARALSRVQLEDHTLSMLGAVVQSLAAVEETGGLEGDLLRDGSAIQEHIAFQHGEQRFRLGWTESMLGREYAILTEETLSLAHRSGADGSAAGRRATDVLSRLLDRAREVSLRGFHHARRFAHS